MNNATKWFPHLRMRMGLSVFLCALLVGCSESQWDMVSKQDIPSPDGRHVATLFEMCSYNTTGDWPHISLRRRGQKFDHTGNVLAGGPGDRFTARWISAHHLAVEYQTASVWQSYPPSVTNIGEVTITFKKL